MSALSFVAECDGFQHGSLVPFTLKCLALACGRARSTYARFFDTTALLHHSPMALRSYQYQADFHGHSLSSPGLPQETASVVLFHAIQEFLLELYEAGSPYPTSLIIWTKGEEKERFIRGLVMPGLGSLPFPLLVRNLEDVECPPARQLQDSDVYDTADKARLFAEWLINNNLDDKNLRLTD